MNAGSDFLVQPLRFHPFLFVPLCLGGELLSRLRGQARPLRSLRSVGVTARMRKGGPLLPAPARTGTA